LARPTFVRDLVDLWAVSVLVGKTMDVEAGIGKGLKLPVLMVVGRTGLVLGNGRIEGTMLITELRL
jgi:hypothetical protein